MAPPTGAEPAARQSSQPQGWAGQVHSPRCDALLAVWRRRRVGAPRPSIGVPTPFSFHLRHALPRHAFPALHHCRSSAAHAPAACLPGCAPLAI